MQIRELSLTNYRNIKRLQMAPHPEVNIIFGDNAQGKTNLIEAIWLFCGAKSFRGAKEQSLIAFEEKSAFLELDFFAEGRQQNATMRLGEKKEVKLNGVPKKTSSALAGHFSAVVFSPTHLSLIKDGPNLRRNFLDLAISQLTPQYIPLMVRYQKVLGQRNILLKDAGFHAELLDTLEVWDQSFARVGTAITKFRYQYVELLKAKARAIYSGISGGKESLEIFYHSSIFGMVENEEQIEEGFFLQKVREASREDLRAGFSTVGPHRDELEFILSGRDLKLYGSQGQHRSAVLALKLAEAAIAEERLGEKPVILLDDVFSELDSKRQNFILNHIEGFQLFLTCCDTQFLSQMGNGSAFIMREGVLSPFEA